MKKSKVILVSIAAVLIVAMLAIAAVAALSSEKVTAILSAIVGGDEYLEANDLNGDGKVDVLDAILAAKHEFFGSPTLKTLKLDDADYTLEFDPLTVSYTFNLPAGRPRIPKLVATADDGLTIDYAQATIADTETEGSATVTVGDGGKSTVYTVKFVRADVEDTVVLQYDDRWTFAPDYTLGEGETFTFESSDSAVVSVDENGVLTAENVSDTAVTVTAKVGGEVKDTLTVAEVHKAQINLFFVTGQSNAHGCYDYSDTDGSGAVSNYEKATQSDKQLEDVVQPEKAGQVYIYDAQPFWSSYNTPHNIAQYQWNDSLSRFYDLNEVKRAGFASALGKTYYDLSGEKVVFLHSAYNGSCIEKWLDPVDYPDLAEADFTSTANYNYYVSTQNAYSKLMALLDGNNYEINHRANFWLQGETCMSKVWDYDANNWADPSIYEKLFSSEDYTDMFMKFHNQMVEDFGIESNNILLVRAHGSVVSNKDTNVKAALNNVRSSQYGMANSYADINIVSRFSDYTVIQNSKYVGTIYEPYIGTMGVGNVHYNQTGHNINGVWAATNYFKKLDVEMNSVATSVELIDTDGIKRFAEKENIGEFEVGATKRIAAFALPDYSLENVSYSSSNEKVANVNEYGLITVVGEGEATITATAESGAKASVIVNGVARTTTPTVYWIDEGDTKSIAKALPEFRFADIKYTSDNEEVATVSDKGVITVVGGGKANVKATSKTGAFVEYVVNGIAKRVTSDSVHYRWDFNGNLKSSADENDLRLSDLATKNGAENNYSFTEEGYIFVDKNVADLNKPDFTMAYPVSVSSDTDWSIEWRAKFTANSVFLGRDNSNVVIENKNKYISHIYTIYNKAEAVESFGNTAYPLRFNDCNGDEIYLSYIDGKYANMNKEMNTWKLEYKKYTGKMTLSAKIDDVWTVVDVIEPGEFSATYNNVLGRYSAKGLVNFEGWMDYLDIVVSPAEVLYDTHYRWDFETGGELDSTYDKNTLTTTASNQVIADGQYKTTTNAGEVKLEKTIVFDTKHDWLVEFQFTTPAGTNNVTLFGTENCRSNGRDQSHFYFAASTWGGVVHIVDDAYVTFDVPFNDASAVQAAMRTMNTWRIGYDMNSNTMMVWLFDKDTNTWNEVGKKESVPSFTLTATCLFGDYNGAGMVSMKGTVEYVDVLVEAQKAITDTHYRWDFETADPYGSTYDANDLTKTDSNHTIDGAYKTTTRAGELKMEKPIVFDTEHDWMVEIEFMSTASNAHTLFGVENCEGKRSHFYFTPQNASGYNGVRIEDDSSVKFCVSFDDLAAAQTALKSMNKWRIQYDMNTNTMAVYLYDTTTHLWNVVGSKSSIPEFTLTATTLFGDYNGSNKVNMSGTVNYVDVIIGDSKRGTEYVYDWQFNDADFVSSALPNDLTVPSTTDYTLSDGVYVVSKSNQDELILGKNIKLDSNGDWYIEWRSAFNQNTASCMLFGTENCQGKYNFIYMAAGTAFGSGKNGPIRIRDAAGNDKYIEYVPGASNATAATNLTKEWNTWRLQYDSRANKLLLLRIDASTDDWVTCNSISYDDFEIEFTRMFGDVGPKSGETETSNFVSFRGSMDYIKVGYTTTEAN